MTKPKKIKIIKIEPLVWNRKDLMISPVIGHAKYRARASGQDLEVPFEDTIKVECRKKNKCLNNCDNYATKIIYLETNVKKVLKLEKYCDECLGQVADLDKMVMRPPVDNSHILEKITVKPSDGATLFEEDWKLKLGDKYKRWTHF